MAVFYWTAIFRSECYLILFFFLFPSVKILAMMLSHWGTSAVKKKSVPNLDPTSLSLPACQDPGTGDLIILVSSCSTVFDSNSIPPGTNNLNHTKQRDEPSLFLGKEWASYVAVNFLLSQFLSSEKFGFENLCFTICLAVNRWKKQNLTPLFFSFSNSNICC